MRKFNALCLFALVAVVAQGCKSISASFSFDERILVKVPYSGDPREVASPSGWCFKPIAAASATNQQQTVPAQWFMAWRPGDQNSKLSGKSPSEAWNDLRRKTPELADVVREVFGQFPMVIEPNLVFGHAAAAPKVVRLTAGTNLTGSADISSVVAHAPPAKVWPMLKNAAGQLHPLWYLDDNFSQLRSARERVETNTPGLDGVIRIGILDCGFDGSHAAMPERVEDEPEANAINVLEKPGQTNSVKPGETGTPHGTGTLGILAGRKVRLSPAPGSVPTELCEDYLGGDPHATIVPVLVAPWVFSFETVNLAYGIDYASRVKHCDVISMSHGGAPCLVWADAVNSAYERGTAIFAATGDFYSLFGSDLGILVPSSTVYPAAFRRVIGVTGVTATGRTYAKNSFLKLLAHAWSLKAWQQWLMRGSYGADFQSRWLFGSRDNPDSAQVWDNGRLHPYPIAAYTPNIPWPLSSADSSAEGQKNLIELDGSGTSAATPQVAAAASLWLRQNYQQITSSNDWNTWKKPEAVYVALLASAARARTNQPDHYLGAGILKARDALALDYARICAMEDTRKNRPDNEKMKRKPVLGYSLAPRDYYDGQRSGAQLLLPWRSQPDFADRADLRQSPRFFSTRPDALKNLYFNGLLLEQYERAKTPKKGAEEHRLDAQAEQWARDFGGSK
jgi:subtilase family protein